MPCPHPLGLTIIGLTCLTFDYRRAYLGGWSPHCPNLRDHSTINIEPMILEIIAYAPAAVLRQQQIKEEG